MEEKHTLYLFQNRRKSVEEKKNINKIYNININKGRTW